MDKEPSQLYALPHPGFTEEKKKKKKQSQTDSELTSEAMILLPKGLNCAMGRPRNPRGWSE